MGYMLNNYEAPRPNDTTECDWCGEKGHDWQAHPEAVAEWEQFRYEEDWDRPSFTARNGRNAE